MNISFDVWCQVSDAQGLLFFCNHRDRFIFLRLFDAKIYHSKKWLPPAAEIFDTVLLHRYCTTEIHRYNLLNIHVKYPVKSVCGRLVLFKQTALLINTSLKPYYLLFLFVLVVTCRFINLTEKLKCFSNALFNFIRLPSFHPR